MLSKDVHSVCVTNANFFFADGQLAIVTGDEEGIIRVHEYNPNGTLSVSLDLLWLILSCADPESRDGRYLLLRTEFHGQSEFRASSTIARRTNDDPMIPQSKLILGLSLEYREACSAEHSHRSDRWLFVLFDTSRRADVQAFAAASRPIDA